VPAAGTYFQLVDYSALSAEDDMTFADRLIRDAKVAIIPLSPFYAEPPKMTLVRLCIAKQDATLKRAAERLCEFADTSNPHDSAKNTS
jgi:methionine aminotransferase